MAIHSDNHVQNEAPVTTKNEFSGLALAPGWDELPYADAKDRALDAFHAAYLGALLRRTGGNISEAARRAGLDRSNFRRVLKRYGNPLAPKTTGGAPGMTSAPTLGSTGTPGTMGNMGGMGGNMGGQSTQGTAAPTAAPTAPNPAGGEAAKHG